MPYGRSKRDNRFAKLVFAIDAPKTVWMALAVSFAHMHGYGLDERTMTTEMMGEWGSLHRQGIVPQKPKRVQQ